MDIKSRFSEKLSHILFLEINKEKIESIFKVQVNEEIYIPIKSENIVEKVKSGAKMDSIPAGYFIEAMFFVLGADENFRFNRVYKKILLNVPESIKFIKGKIYKAVDKKQYEDAYIMLKGLIEIEENEENYSKLIMLADKLRSLDRIYKEEELSIIEKAKSIFSQYAMPYLYECLIKRDDKDYENALFALNNYLSIGGEETKEITELKISLKNVVDYEKGKQLIYDDPKKSLSLLIPLLDEFNDDAELYYYIAIAYRVLENYEKAIYYLIEAVNIDSNMPELINELGINYASLGNFEKAIEFLRKAFEVTKSVEICTNLIMCYINAGKIEEAKKHLDIAKKLDSQDEIVIELDSILNSNNN